MSGTDSSIEKPTLQRGDTVGGWEVVRQLGCGGFGSVYEMRRGDERAALKAEIIDTTGENSETLRQEVRVYRLLGWSQHFCQLRMAGTFPYDRDRRMNAMLISIVGKALSKLRRQCAPQHFTRSTAMRLARQTLQAIADLHSVGYIHRDVKAGNFAVCGRTIVLLDLGFCRNYLEWRPDGDSMRMRRPRKRAHFLGTHKYCSPNTHTRKEQGRRDDLWCWLYMVVEFFTGRLPWRNEDNERKIAKMKKDIGSNLFNGVPVEMIHVYDHIRSMEWHSKPNYALMHKLLEKRYGYVDSDALDWEEGGRWHKEEKEGEKQVDLESSATSELESQPRSAVTPSESASRSLSVEIIGAINRIHIQGSSLSESDDSSVQILN